MNIVAGLKIILNAIDERYEILEKLRRDDDYSDIYEIFKKSKRAAFITKKAMGERPVKRIVRNATIRVKPYKRKPQVYNIFFDKVGVGINFGKWQFL